MRYKLTLIAAAAVAFFGAVFTGALFYLSDLLLFPFKEREKWMAVETIDCTKWMKEYAYADLRDGFPSDKPLDMSCDDALKLSGQSFYTKSTLGDRIHYKIYDNLTAEQLRLPTQLPLFFHVHGVSGTHMHGTRYFKMASRLGFQLVVMDLSNHGLSDHNGLGASYGCREQHDVVAVLNALKEQFPGRKILMHGTSMGSMAALNAAALVMPKEAAEAEKTILAFALENPIPSVEQLVLSTPKKPNVPQSSSAWAFGWLRSVEKSISTHVSRSSPRQKFLFLFTFTIQSTMTLLLPKFPDKSQMLCQKENSFV
jgi:pimeloyl-ACP methyl ester carboxylesterase